MNDSPRNPIVPSNSVAILGSVATCANVLVTIIIVALMIRDKYAASTAAISAVTFFIISTTTALLTLSGTLTAVITNAQDQHTARSLHSLQFHAPVAVELVQPLQLPHSPNVPAQLPSGDNYVAAVEHNDARKEALLWTMQSVRRRRPAQPAQGQPQRRQREARQDMDQETIARRHQIPHRTRRGPQFRQRHTS